jgi:hypothetical protein
MLRRHYVVGLAGLVMIGLGVGLYLRGSVHRLSLLYWLGGPFLCFAGAALFMGAILWPMFYRHHENSQPPASSNAGQHFG